MSKRVCIIPARMASSRFPGKPMVPLLGLPLILHVWERCRRIRGLDVVAVATCDVEIAQAVEAAGGVAIMTADTHPGCVDRTVEAIDRLGITLTDEDSVLMVQGDEVMITAEMCDLVLDTQGRTRAPVVNLASRLYRPEDQDDPNAVKVVWRPDGQALFFSRSAIPSRFRATDVAVYQQTGVIAFTRSFLEIFGNLPRTPLEVAEQIDMLRTLEHGHPVQIVSTEIETIGVDTPADRDRGEQMLRAQPFTRLYLEFPA